MSENIIVLKKKEPTAQNSVVENVSETTESTHEEPKEGNGQSSYHELFWEAFEYEKITRSGYWYASIVGGAFLLSVIAVIARNYFFLAFVVLATLLLLYYSRRPPERVGFSLSPEGIFVGKTLYPYHDLKSFWIFDRNGRAELSLERNSLLHSVIRIPLGDTKAVDVREYLLEYIPQEEHIENLYDRVTRAIGM